MPADPGDASQDVQPDNQRLGRYARHHVITHGRQHDDNGKDNAADDGAADGLQRIHLSRLRFIISGGFSDSYREFSPPSGWLYYRD
jgi:hypothetical protein